MSKMGFNLNVRNVSLFIIMFSLGMGFVWMYAGAFLASWFMIIS